MIKANHYYYKFDEALEILLEIENREKPDLRYLIEIPMSDDSSQLPKHIAIVMDGNGRWAKKQGKLRMFGHEKHTYIV